MDKRIVYTRPDGGISVVIPTGEVSLDTVLALDVPADATNVEVTDVTSVPNDRTFRDEWVYKGDADCWQAGAVGISKTKARSKHMDRIRAIRDRELAKLDVEYQRADEQANASKKSEVATKKQALRDIPQSFDLTVADSPEALAALWPANLPRE